MKIAIQVVYTFPYLNSFSNLSIYLKISNTPQDPEMADRKRSTPLLEIRLSSRIRLIPVMIAMSMVEAKRKEIRRGIKTTARNKNTQVTSQYHPLPFIGVSCRYASMALRPSVSKSSMSSSCCDWDRLPCLPGE